MKINKEYKVIASEILNSNHFIQLKNDNHHGTNKYDHCKRVSYLSFLLSKILKGNYRKAARAGLLHDFFFGTRTDKEENGYLKHPKTSVNNAKKFFDIDDIEANIIESHMFHHALLKKATMLLRKEDDKKYYKDNKPKDKDSVIVCVSDMLVSFYEVCAFKIKYSISLYIVFFINLIRY